MTLLYLDDVFSRHDTGRHPENARRIEAIKNQFIERGLVDRCQRPAWAPATDQQQHRAHTEAYTSQVRSFAEAGGGQIEQDTVVSPQSWHVTQHAAGAACDAVDRIVAGESTNAFCAIRPPGHHALRGAAMGFCLLNNVAIAARHATEALGLDRVLIIDWDVHHGNGTQAIFYEDPQVGFYSIHRWPFYPGTGDSNETGTGTGLGTTRNDPIPFGTDRKSFVDQFTRSVEQFAAHMQPQLILLSAGFDAHRKDPIGSLGLETEDFAKLTRIILSVANHHCDGRLVSLLEGGYDPQALAESASLHVEALLEDTAKS